MHHPRSTHPLHPTVHVRRVKRRCQSRALFTHPWSHPIRETKKGSPSGPPRRSVHTAAWRLRQCKLRAVAARRYQSPVASRLGHRTQPLAALCRSTCCSSVRRRCQSFPAHPSRRCTGPKHACSSATDGSTLPPIPARRARATHTTHAASRRLAAGCRRLPLACRARRPRGTAAHAKVEKEGARPHAMGGHDAGGRSPRERREALWVMAGGDRLTSDH